MANRLGILDVLGKLEVLECIYPVNPEVPVIQLQQVSNGKDAAATPVGETHAELPATA